MAHEVEMKALAAYLEQHHLKHTKQRELILATFLEAKRHVTSEDLYTTVREQHPNIGYTTVYRTMKLLVEAGPVLAGSLLDGGYLDELVIYQAPHIMGSETMGMFRTPGWTELGDRRDLEIIDVLKARD